MKFKCEYKTEWSAQTVFIVFTIFHLGLCRVHNSEPPCLLRWNEAENGYTKLVPVDSFPYTPDGHLIAPCIKGVNRELFFICYRSNSLTQNIYSETCGMLPTLCSEAGHSQRLHVQCTSDWRVIIWYYFMNDTVYLICAVVYRQCNSVSELLCHLTPFCQLKY